MPPTYSIIIPTCNRVGYLREAIDSVLAQTCRDFELIVCDDGSTDETPALLSAYAGQIRALRLAHAGQAAARNAGVAAAAGNFIGFLDSDDAWSPWTLECIDQVVRGTNGDACVFLKPVAHTGGLPSADPGIRLALRFEIFESFFATPRGVPEGAGMMGAIPQRFFREIGGFDEQFLNGEDTDMTLRLARTARYALIHAPVTVRVRVHAEQISREFTRQLAGWNLIRKRYCQGTYSHPRLAGLEHRRLGQMMMGRAYYLPSAGHWRAGLRFFTTAVRAARRARFRGGLGWSTAMYALYFPVILSSGFMSWMAAGLAAWTHRKRQAG